MKEFFKRHIDIIIKGRIKCTECLTPLKGIHAEVCHIISKGDRYNPEVALVDDNIIYLCPNCHNQFDRTLRHRSDMKCFTQSIEQFKKFQHLLEREPKEVRFYKDLI